jgi:hypothetical protein
MGQETMKSLQNLLLRFWNLVVQSGTSETQAVTCIIQFATASHPVGTKDDFLKWSGRGVKLITHFQLVPRSIKCQYMYPLPHNSSWYSS